jgi:hypothetical protein
LLWQQLLEWGLDYIIYKVDSHHHTQVCRGMSSSYISRHLINLGA